MTTAAVVNLSSEAMERIGRRIDAAWRRVHQSTDEWVDGSIELMQALKDARDRFTADRAFGDWLRQNDHNHFNRQDRAALLCMASDITVARDVLTSTSRRSYRLIWKETRNRFSNAGRPTRRSGRPHANPGRGRRRNNPSISRDQEEALARAVLDERRSLAEASSDAGLQSDMVARFAVAREQGRREALAELLDAAGIRHFTDRGAVRVEDAIRIHRARLNNSFEQQVSQEVQRRIAAADDATRRNNAELRQENIRLTTMLNQRGVLTERQFNQLLMCIHPDNSASTAIRNEMLQLVVANKRRLMKEN